MLHFIKTAFSLARDLIKPPSPQDILVGKSLFRPFLRYQQSWMHYCYPQDQLSFDHDSWFYLKKYMLPLIKQHASDYHLKGIALLSLDREKKPNFNQFQDLFYKVSRGFEIFPATGEVAPLDYFHLIKAKKFPCIAKLRSLDALFCGNEPDFWHEAIGHLAPLCCPEIQAFYLAIAEYILSSKTSNEFENNLAIAWTLMEYGFIQEKNQYKMLGAALVGSHLAHMRYRNGWISIEPGNRSTIIKSQFYSEKSLPPRDKKGRLRFFSLNSLEISDLFNQE